jgi:hypothetical protein
VVVFGECVDLCHQLVYISSQCEVRLGNLLHVFVDGIHIVDVGRLLALAVFGEMPHLSAVEAWTFRAFGLVVLLYWYLRHIAVLRLGEVGVRVVVLVLSSVIGGPGAGQIHRHLYVIVSRARGVGGIIGGSLLLLLRLWLTLGTSFPRAWSKLVLPLIDVVPSRVW